MIKMNLPTNPELPAYIRRSKDSEAVKQAKEQIKKLTETIKKVRK
jgi:4-alpha-glucanotransferase